MGVVILWVWTTAGKVDLEIVVVLAEGSSKYGLGNDCCKFTMNLSAHPFY